ncbi:MAG: Tex family protein [Legionellaceae bacterium]
MGQEILTLATRVARELRVNVSQVNAAIRLLDEGATVPFIARYRKEATGGLDDTQLRLLTERLYYLRELDARRQVILESLRELDQLTPKLEHDVLEADTKTRLEDLYLPYRPKRRTRAYLAKEAGLLPLAEALLRDPGLDPASYALAFVDADKQVPDVDSALDGARHILMEQFAEDPDLLQSLRAYVWQHGVLSSVAAKNKKPTANKFSDYFKYAEPIKTIPSHRALALFRGRREHALQLSLTLPDDPDYGIHAIARHVNIVDQARPADAWLMETVVQTWKTKLSSKLEIELLARLREHADDEAIRVFTRNLRDLLLAAPAGQKVTIGLDPGLRTGVKVVVVDVTGKLLDYATIFPFAPQNSWHDALATLAKFVAKYDVSLISIGNGTGSRDTERLVSDLIKMYPDMSFSSVLVSEAGASVYSASAKAAEEFPDLDVTLRGAVSIARRLQDPLAELVKIEPKAIGVGQYQHDVNQPRLARTLEGVVEDCVNKVGVDVNMASAALLTYVAGLNEGLAKQVVAYRDEHGLFKAREQLKDVARMGEKTYQQAVGFLRIMKGDNPLDASGVHPEAYPLVERILKEEGLTLEAVMGQATPIQIDPSRYVDEVYGLPTVQDVLKELEKPGRDPRGVFKTVQFKEGIEKIEDLKVDMILEGVVSNVTNFGAFVDVGVHQDGLVHISMMTDKFIRDPHALVKAGDVVQSYRG